MSAAEAGARERGRRGGEGERGRVPGALHRLATRLRVSPSSRLGVLSTMSCANLSGVWEGSGTKQEWRVVVCSHAAKKHLFFSKYLELCNLFGEDFPATRNKACFNNKPVVNARFINTCVLVEAFVRLCGLSAFDSK